MDKRKTVRDGHAGTRVRLPHQPGAICFSDQVERSPYLKSSCMFHGHPALKPEQWPLAGSCSWRWLWPRDQRRERSPMGQRGAALSFHKAGTASKQGPGLLCAVSAAASHPIPWGPRWSRTRQNLSAAPSGGLRSMDFIPDCHGE